MQVDLGQPAAIDQIVMSAAMTLSTTSATGFGFPVRYRIEVSDDPGVPAGPDDAGRRSHAGRRPESGRPAADGFRGGPTRRYVRVTATKLAPRQNDYIFALAELQVLAADGRNLAAGRTVTALDSIEAPVRWQNKNLVDGYYFGVAADPELKAAGPVERATSSRPGPRAVVRSET